MAGFNDDNHGQRFHASYNFDVGQDELNFQSFGDASQMYDSNQYLNPANPPSFQGNIFTPTENIGGSYSGTENFEDEPPLLEELGINPEHIFQKNTNKAEISDILKELIAHACLELRRSVQVYNDEDDNHRKIITELGIDSNILSQVPKPRNTFDFNSVMMAETEKLEKMSHKLFIATMDQYLNSFKNAIRSFEEYHATLSRELEKYELAYVKESQNCKVDLLDLTSIQTSILKLQDDIHQANEQQEHKKSIINKLSQCFEIHTKIKECNDKKQQIADSLKNLRTLPPNLAEAEVRLGLLKQKFKEVCDTFSREATMK